MFLVVFKNIIKSIKRCSILSHQTVLLLASNYSIPM